MPKIPIMFVLVYHLCSVKDKCHMLLNPKFSMKYLYMHSLQSTPIFKQFLLLLIPLLLNLDCNDTNILWQNQTVKLPVGFLCVYLGLVD